MEANETFHVYMDHKNVCEMYKNYCKHSKCIEQ